MNQEDQMNREPRVCFYPTFTRAEAAKVLEEATSLGLSPENLIRQKFGLDEYEKPVPTSSRVSQPIEKNETLAPVGRPRLDLTAWALRDAENQVRRLISKIRSRPLQPGDAYELGRRRAVDEFLARVAAGREVASNLDALNQLIQVTQSRVNGNFSQVPCSLDPKPPVTPEVVPPKKRRVPKP